MPVHKVTKIYFLGLKTIAKHQTQLISFSASYFPQPYNRNNNIE